MENQQRTNYHTIKMETVPVEDLEGLPTQSVAAVRQTTNKLDMRKALHQRVAQDVQEKMPGDWEYVKPTHTFEYDGEHFTLHRILGYRDGVMWVSATRSSTGNLWFNGIPEQTEFHTTFYRPI